MDGQHSYQLGSFHFLRDGGRERKTGQQEPQDLHLSQVIILLLCGVALARIPLGPRAGKEDWSGAESLSP